MSLKRKRNLSLSDVVKEAGQSDLKLIASLDQQITSLEQQKQIEMEKMYEKKFAALKEAERENPFNRMAAMSKKRLTDKGLIEIPGLSWDEIKPGTQQEMAAFLQMKPWFEERNYLVRKGSKVHYPKMTVCKYYCLIAGNYHSVAVQEDRIFDLSIGEFQTGYTHYLPDLKKVKNEIPSDGKSWCWGIEVCVDLQQVAETLFEFLVPHICGRNKEKHGGLVKLICHYVHYSTETNPFLETVARMAQSY